MPAASHVRDSDSVLVAVGGNAIHPDHITGTTEEQEALAASAAQALLPLLRMDARLVVTHGNGPVVGKILLRQILTRDQVAPMRLDVCVAHSQGGIAYLLTQAMENALRQAGSQRMVACLLTQVEVDPSDPAFGHPSKPIGTFFSEAEARALTAQGWNMMEDAGRGWRYAVASPLPRGIVNLSLIDTMARTGAIVIAGGGGGIPVVRADDGRLHGIEAVIDKDLTSALMANLLGIDTLLILTSVPRVAIHFGKPAQRDLGVVSVAELTAYRAEGHFASGSMAPKIDAVLRFLAHGGKRAIVAHLEQAAEAFRGEAGTHVAADA
ncbi:MAG: carbamate kinase [Burkholderiales bacterium]|nr:carbamate kinase [Burkholderiales bacterium]